MTTGLERKAHRLVELARAADDPSAAQLLSLHGAVAARIAAEGASAASAAGVGTKAASAGVFVKGLVAASALATAAAGFFALPSTPEPAAPRIVVASVAAPPPASLQPLATAVLAPVTAEPSAPAARPASRPRSSSLRLQDEAALLAEVQGALRNGQASLALGKLESYDRRFPGGVLRSEADAARVFALCAVGKADKARAAAARFVQRYPNAPATARVQGACK
jgi:hypothetical protein